MYVKSRAKVDSLARIKDIVFAWNVADTVYTGYFYFNKDEVLEYFDKAYGKKKGQKGVFVIKVSKFNDWFDICLRIGEQEFKFEKTRIHVFKQGVVSCSNHIHHFMPVYMDANPLCTYV